jgi:hypothetical protein
MLGANANLLADHVLGREADLLLPGDLTVEYEPVLDGDLAPAEPQYMLIISQEFGEIKYVGPYSQERAEWIVNETAGRQELAVAVRLHRCWAEAFPNG